MLHSAVHGQSAHNGAWLAGCCEVGLYMHVGAGTHGGSLGAWPQGHGMSQGELGGHLHVAMGGGDTPVGDQDP